MKTINIQLNSLKDAWNWWEACNKISYGTDWKQRIDIKLQNELVNKTQKQALIFLIPYLKVLYEEININQKKKELSNILNKQSQKIFSRMQKVTGRKIYRNDFTCFLTTFPRAPYNYHRGYVWIPIIWPKETYVRTFVHELLHFQTYAYWQKQCLESMTKKEFENLKEAVTVILNEEFLDLIVWFDKGYEIHKELRAELLEFWKFNRNFDKLIKHGMKIYPQFF